MKFSVAVARSPSDDNAAIYVLPVLWMTSCFHTMGQIKIKTIGELFRVTCQMVRKRSLLFCYSALLLTCCFKLPDDRQACYRTVAYMCAWHGWFVFYSCDDRNVSSYNKLLIGSEASITRRTLGVFNRLLFAAVLYFQTACHPLGTNVIPVIICLVILRPV